MMENGMITCFVILLISFAHVHARYKLDPIPRDKDPCNRFVYMENLSPESICETCLEPSKEAQKISKDSKLFQELSMLSAEVCHVLPSDYKTKCFEASEAYVHRTTLLVNGIFNEETLCNSTGLCLLKSMYSAINCLASVSDNPAEVTDESTCAACRRSVRDIFIGLNSPKMRMRVMEALIEYCEEVEYGEQNCKENVYKYAPMVLSKLEKLKTSDFCHMMGFCDEGML